VITGAGGGVEVGVGATPFFGFTTAGFDVGDAPLCTAGATGTVAGRATNCEVTAEGWKKPGVVPEDGFDRGATFACRMIAGT
jgi:hypothetical protein